MKDVNRCGLFTEFKLWVAQMWVVQLWVVQILSTVYIGGDVMFIFN